MKFYCGIDLHARKSSLVVIDEEGEKVGQTTVSNNLERILSFLKPYGEEVTCTVESTYNWYWLVDGLREHGYDVRLAHAYGLHLISGSKFKSDIRDAHRLARLQRLGEIPESYIYPAETRPLRDLMRERIRLVRERGRLKASVRNTLSRYNLRVDDPHLERVISENLHLLPLPDEVKMGLAASGGRHCERKRNIPMQAVRHAMGMERRTTQDNVIASEAKQPHAHDTSLDKSR